MDELHQALTNGAHARARDLATKRLEADPRDTYARATLGVALQKLGDLAGAVVELERAASQNLEDAASRFNLALALEGLGELDRAINCYRDALNTDPRLLAAALNLASALTRKGDRGRAEAAYRRALEIDQRCDTARHMVAALAGQTTGAAPAEFVRAIFDAAAPTFDQHLEELEYETPQRLLELASAAKVVCKRVLDLGCGTGLFGAIVRGHAGYLAGVDLSEAMLAKARQKDVYDELICADIVGYLESRDETWDLIAASDVLVYVGDLEPLFRAVCLRIGPGGALAISTERCEGGSFVLQPSGRYAHDKSYVKDVAELCGLSVVAETSAELRLERGEAVPGALFVLRHER